jgi:hypothetical protein
MTSNLFGGDSSRSSISRLVSLCFSGASSLVPTPLCPAGNVAISLCPLSISTVAILISGFFFFPIISQARPGLESTGPPFCAPPSEVSFAPTVGGKTSVRQCPGVRKTRPAPNTHPLNSKKEQGPPRLEELCGTHSLLVQNVRPKSAGVLSARSLLMLLDPGWVT